MISLSFSALSDIFLSQFCDIISVFESVFHIACVSICVPRINQNSQL